MNGRQKSHLMGDFKRCTRAEKGTVPEGVKPGAKEEGRSSISHEMITKSTKQRKQTSSLLVYFYKDFLGNLKGSRELKYDAVRERTTARCTSV